MYHCDYGEEVGVVDSRCRCRYCCRCRWTRLLICPGGCSCDCDQRAAVLDRTPYRAQAQRCRPVNGERCTFAAQLTLGLLERGCVDELKHTVLHQHAPACLPNNSKAACRDYPTGESLVLYILFVLFPSSASRCRTHGFSIMLFEVGGCAIQHYPASARITPGATKG